MGKKIKYIESEDPTRIVDNSEDVKKILCEQIKLLAIKSKECEGPNLHFTSSIILEIGKYLNEYYFGAKVQRALVETEGSSEK